jgi:undecaprenyl-diphosphatase
MMVGVGIIFAVVDRFASRVRDESSLGPRDALAIGIGQAVALIPGTSRSGSTMAVGLALGLNRTSAARFSFLLSAPITFGAVAKQAADVARLGPTANDLAMYAVGAITAGISGALAIHGLMRFVRTRSFAPFVAYRIVAGGIVIGLAVSGRIPSLPHC